MSVSSVVRFRKLLNSRVVWYRETTARDQFGDVVVGWQEQSTPDGLNARPDQAWAGVLQDSGPGEQQTNKRRWFLDKRFEGVAERDVLAVVSGPDAPVLLRVEGVTPQWDSVHLHHIEVNVEVWQGSLEELPIDIPPDDPAILVVEFMT
jgi:hypothetical protein